MMTSRLTTSFARLSRQQVSRPLVAFRTYVTDLETRDTTEDFTQLNHKSILYFTASWCEPCKKFSPVYADIAKSYDHEIGFGKIDVDVNPEAATEYDITAVPTFVLNDGEDEIERIVGADEAKLKEALASLDKR
eukprot:Nitzschia sp. Nitz4//scaffold4_size323378//2203//2694//NITZ4_000601-RA/size323378-snap-gene-0.396-mRNA-1//1//CDS//3329553222//4670//frame0